MRLTDRLKLESRSTEGDEERQSRAAVPAQHQSRIQDFRIEGVL